MRKKDRVIVKFKCRKQKHRVLSNRKNQKFYMQRPIVKEFYAHFQTDDIRRATDDFHYTCSHL